MRRSVVDLQVMRLQMWLTLVWSCGFEDNGEGVDDVEEVVRPVSS